jgi:hypothetical protein
MCVHMLYKSAPLPELPVTTDQKSFYSMRQLEM